jgi:glycine cleavage system H protein
MAVPADRKYRETHEWFKLDGNIVTIGITKFAADELTDITYVSLPEVGRKISAEATFGEIESVKATADLYSAVAGDVIEVNTKLADAPELLNTDPFGAGWMVKLRCTDASPLNGLMDAASYDRKTGG